MPVSLSDEHRAVRRTARRFAENELEPIALEWERRGEFPESVLEEIVDLNMRGFRVSEAYGGNEMDKLSHVLVVEEFSKVWPSAGFELNEPVIRNVRLAANEDQKECYLPDLCNGMIGAAAFSEPDHGSDFGAIETTAERENDGYVLNGTKTWCTSAGLADVIMVCAKTDPDADHRGISMFLIDTDTDGIEVEPRIDFMVHRASSSHTIRLSDCYVPAEDLLGEKNRGFYQAMEYLAESRIQAAARALGIAAGAYAEALSYAQEREAFDRAISEFQSIQHKLADMETKVEAARHLVYRSAELCDAGEDFGTAAAKAKLFASRVAREVANEAVQIHGANGLTNDYAVSMFYRDAKATEIYDGTSEIQRNIVADAILDG